MKNLKVFYFLTLCALCLYMAIGPAQAGTVESDVVIRNTGVTVSPVQGTVNWVRLADYLPAGPAWQSPGYGATVSLGLDAQCVSTAPCVDTVGFSFIVGTADPAPVTISLSGTSTDPNANGTVAFYDGEPGGKTIGYWTTSGNVLMMTPFIVETPGSFGTYYGEFTFNLAPGNTLTLPIQTSLDFTTEEQPGSSTPEPGSAMLLGVGIACVGFLRRKVHG